MDQSISAKKADAASLDVAVVAILLEKGEKLGKALRDLDERAGGSISRTLDRGDFRGARDETLHLAGGSKGPARILLVGMGEPKDRAGSIRRAAAIAARQAGKLGCARMALHLGSTDEKVIEAAAAGIAAGMWSYTDLQSPPPADERRDTLTEAVILVEDEKRATDAIRNGSAIGAGHSLARRLAMMPGNVCTPDLLADTAREIAGRHGMKVSVMGRSEMEKEKMGAFLAVAQGTPQEPRLVTIEYKGGGGAPIVLVGKGLCFDTGGVSIKPAQGMESMKFDMCGAAGVLGAMEAIGQMKLRVNVVGIIGATTNMVSGTAVKPGDVVRSSLGKYIEIINTDAEGRLVLADLLAYASRFKPAAVIDAATLTGAVVIALGHTAVGVFGADESLVEEVLAAGKRAGEPGWPLPIWDDYKELIKSDVADIKNSGGRAAGSISAAMFLKEFTGDYPWVHLDIAGTAYSETDLVSIPRGPTGVPVGTFVEFVRGRVG